jgi:hypothetical protein
MVYAVVVFLPELLDKISRLPLFLQVILAVIAVGIGFALLRKFVKLAVWLIIIMVAIILYQRYFG